MAPSLSDGVPGLEALHTLTPPSPFSTFTLNDWMDPSTGNTYQWGVRSAFSSLTDISGIHDSPDADDPRVKLVYQPGELPLPRLPRGRTITYSGWIAGKTLSDMRAHIAAVRACCNSALANPTAWYLSVAYNSTYDTSGLQFKAWGIPVGFTCDDSLRSLDGNGGSMYGASGDTVPSPHLRYFTLSFRQSDGRWWVANSGALCSVGSSSSKIDDGTSGTLTLTGTAPSEPTFTVYGTGSGESTIVITATEVSGKLTIDLPSAMSSGDTLVVDFGARSVTYTPSGDSAVDYTGFIDWANSNWWNEADVVPTLLVGDNTLKVTGDKWSATAMPACW